VASLNYIRVLTILTAMAAAVVAALLALSVLGSPAVAGSTDLKVTKTADTNDGACDGDCSLREAVIRSNTDGADAIEVPPGTYTLTIENTTSSDEDFAATGDLDIRKGVTIRKDNEQGTGATIIDANGIDRVFHTPFQNTSTPFTLGIFSVKITGGVSDFGGGIFHDADDATLFLGRSTVRGNQSESGGGIVAQRGPLNVQESTISNNRAPDGQGGGIYISGPAPNTITNTTVSGNQSRFGGGIDTYEPVTITDSTIAFNTAQQPGGGLHVSGGLGPYTLKNTIVSNNKSDFADFNNCQAAGGPDSFASEGNNLEKGTSCDFDQPSDINAGPRLGDLANNGGPTNTHALLADSPAINAGGDPFPPTDQRGVARPQGFANDIGAFEKEQSINVVQCPTGGSSPDECVGTTERDALVGRDDSFDLIKGRKGNDVYNGKGG
jgi:CSLREA domain-containing protein